MMLEFQDRKSSPVLTFVLALFFSAFGAHRFYLGQRNIGGIILGLTVALTLLATTEFAKHSNPLWMLFAIFLLVETILTPYYTSRVNRRLKSELETKYGVLHV